MTEPRREHLVRLIKALSTHSVELLRTVPAEEIFEAREYAAGMGIAIPLPPKKKRGPYKKRALSRTAR